MLSEDRTEQLLATIAQLGGQAMKEEDIVFEGKRLVLPEDFRGDLERAIKFLKRRIKEDEETAVFIRDFKYRPWDGALCAYRAMKKAFGMVHGKTVKTFFGDNPPRYIQIPINSKETEEAPWGQFQVPLLDDALINFGSTDDSEHGQVFQIVIHAPRKYRFVVEGLFKLVQEELDRGSIYRGKAIDGQKQPNFLDLSSLDPSKIVYSDQVQNDLEANIWAVMKYGEQQKELGLPLKRAVLISGTYGVGKSLAGWLTAQEAVDNGWTFIMSRPGRDNFLEVMQTARLYQPACVFFEDAENVAGADNNDMISEILDTFDGIQAKSTSLMVVLTTNHPDLIHKGMHRPGRVDSQIEIGPLDNSGIERLIRALIPEGILSDEVEFEPVFEACTGFVPAFVKETADRAVRYALVRTGGIITNITTDDLINAALGLRPQFNRMNAASESTTTDPSLTTMVREAAKTGVADLAAKEEEADKSIRDSVWDPNAVTVAQSSNGH